MKNQTRVNLKQVPEEQTSFKGSLGIKTRMGSYIVLKHVAENTWMFVILKMTSCYTYVGLWGGVLMM